MHARRAENIDSNDAVNMVAVQSWPAAKKATYDMPSTEAQRARP